MNIIVKRFNRLLLVIAFVSGICFKPYELHDTQHVSIAYAKPVLTDSFKCSSKVPLKKEYQLYLNKMCSKYKIPYSMALAVIETESSFRENCSNGKSVGLMQIHEICRDNLRKKLGVADIKNPYQNMHSGVFMLSNLHRKYGSWNKALVCYNHGESGAYNNVFKFGKVDTEYSKKVIRRYKKWSNILAEKEGE